MVEKLVYGGEGLARIDGRVVLTPFVLPGETVRVATVKETGGLLRARVVEVLKKAPERVAPECPYFRKCGGCHYQHAPYEDQLKWKRAILREVFQRIGKLIPPEEIGVVSGPPLEYRNRVQLHLSEGRIGYHRIGSHRLYPIERCPIAAPKINEALVALREMIPQPRFPKFVRSLELFTNGEQVQLNVLDSGRRRVARGFFDWCAKTIPGSGADHFDYPVGGDVFRVGRRSFFQVNRFLVEKMTDAVLDGVEGNFAADLYAGVGLFSHPLRRRFERVTAVESGQSAVEDLAFNAKRAGLEIEALYATTEAYLEQIRATPDCIVADPPRAGLGKPVVERLVGLASPQLRIVSCDPATLARDLSSLLAGGYRLEKLILVDLFPQTYHIETVAHLRRG